MEHMTCPDCERPMATDANLRSDAMPRPEDDLLCWRAFHGNQCQQPIDWRERCKATEADIAAAAGEVRVSLDEMPPGSKMRRVVIVNRLLLHERNEFWGRVVDLDRENAILLERLFDQAETAEQLLEEQIEATECERELWAIVADSRWEEVWSRDDALEACQKRISGLLDRISGLLSDHALFVAHYDEARENAPRALTDALSDIARIAGERDQAQRETSLLQATVLGLLAVRTLTPDHIEVLREMRQEAAVQQARVGADEYAPAWAVEESRARAEALGAVLGEEPSDV